ncbi:biotin transport system permease protein [Propionicimonas paludicola]|uniref:Biotin transport system permease protein n=1 Tax=Propionicimonas paludicola TaxID=185243 RepID=A0A2A9CQ06_9ACTN|nr:energy-coupling factor transporter transmembrane protein EcfT [Propionicimonas paludicola]PFG16504.1 biotin transport system permease protein [Propionicimonas paludicola]
MRTTALLGIYRPGNSWLHRLPVGPKLAGLAALSIAIVAVRGALSAVVFAVIVAALVGWARLGWLTLWRQTRPVLLIALVVGAFQWWLSGPDRAVESLIDLVSLTLAALVVTATTQVNDMLDAIVRWSGPLPWVDSERVGLLLALAIRAVPASIELARETQDAAAARGLGNNPRALISPFVIRVVARAQLTGDALAARGIGD